MRNKGSLNRDKIDESISALRSELESLQIANDHLEQQVVKGKRRAIELSRRIDQLESQEDTSIGVDTGLTDKNSRRIQVGQRVRVNRYTTGRYKYKSIGVVVGRARSTKKGTESTKIVVRFEGIPETTQRESRTAVVLE